MNRDKAHDVLHVWNGNKAENCPVCSGALKNDEEIVNAAKEVAADNFRPRIKPGLGMDEALYCDENGKPIEKSATEAVVTASEEKSKDEKKAEVKPKKLKMSEMVGKDIGTEVDVMSFSEDGAKLPNTIKIIPTGTFKTQAYGDVVITKDDLLEMAKNFADKVRAGVPIDIDHDQKEAAGWIKDVQVHDDGMYADVEWTPLGVDKLSSKQYRFFSPEFSPQYIDPEHSVEMSNVLIAGSLVNRPMFKELPAIAGSEDGSEGNLTKNSTPLMLFITNTKDTQNTPEIPNTEQSSSILTASEKEKPMDLQAVLAKEKSTRTSEEQTFVAQSLDQLSNDQKIAEGFVVTASEEKKEEVKADSAPQGDAVITASEKPGTVVISASEYQTLKAGADKGELAFKELDRKNVTEIVRKYQFNEKGGKFAPAQGDQLVEIMFKMSEPDRKELEKFLEGLPDKQIFGEKGSDKDVDKNQLADMLTIKAKEIAASKNIALSEAYKVARQENPDLKDYQLQPSANA